AHSRPMRNRPGSVLEAQITDGSGATLTLVFFGRQREQQWRERQLRPGRWGLFAGTVTEYRAGRRVVWQLAHPDYELLDEPEDEVAADYASELIPIYPATAKVKLRDITRAVRLVLDVVEIRDPLPERVRTRHGLVPLPQALRDIHRPPSWEVLRPARHRLAWDEAFAVQVTLVQRRRRAERLLPAKARPRRPGGLLDAFDAALPYQLTAGQRRVGEELAAELAQPHPMHRLLQGEVGSGKTVCAIRAALQVVDAGGQAALLAPTEVLAAQHHRSLTTLLGPLGRAGELDGDPEGTRVVLITGSQSAAAGRAARAAVRSGEAGIVVGTHALLYEGVEFDDRGLASVDEQPRSGVGQRDAGWGQAARATRGPVRTAA